MSRKSIREIEQMGCDELEEWLAYERLYGIPDVFFMTAQICMTLEMCLSTKKKFHPGDHVPYFSDQDGEQTTGEMLDTLGRMAREKDLSE
jgi:hypothetical protein